MLALCRLGRDVALHASLRIREGTLEVMTCTAPGPHVCTSSSCRRTPVWASRRFGRRDASCERSSMPQCVAARCRTLREVQSLAGTCVARIPGWLWRALVRRAGFADTLTRILEPRSDVAVLLATSPLFVHRRHARPADASRHHDC